MSATNKRSFVHDRFCNLLHDDPDDHSKAHCNISKLEWEIICIALDRFSMFLYITTFTACTFWFFSFKTVQDNIVNEYLDNIRICNFDNCGPNHVANELLFDLIRNCKLRGFG